MSEEKERQKPLVYCFSPPVPVAKKLKALKAEIEATTDEVRKRRLQSLLEWLSRGELVQRVELVLHESVKQFLDPGSWYRGGHSGGFQDTLKSFGEEAVKRKQPILLLFSCHGTRPRSKSSDETQLIDW